jgi:archaellum component FlaC
MSQPGNEARLTNLEKEAMALGARIEEAAADSAEELKAIRQDIKQLDDGMKSSFTQIGDAFTLLDSNIEAVKTTLETRLSKIEETQEQILKLLQQRPL